MSKCPGLRVNFSPADVSDVAQEIAKNWLMKIVSIRGEFGILGCNSIDILGLAQFRTQNPAQNVAQVLSNRTQASSISHCLGRPKFNWHNFVAQFRAQWKFGHVSKLQK